MIDGRSIATGNGKLFRLTKLVVEALPSVVPLTWKIINASKSVALYTT